MNKLREIFDKCRTYLFWTLCVANTVAVLAVWFLTSVSLHTETGKRQIELRKKFVTSKDLVNSKLHYNEHSFRGMDDNIDKLRSEISRAWNEQYKHQESVLTWPKELEEDFIERVAKMRPIETIPFPTPPKVELTEDLRRRYQNNASQIELPKLAETIRAGKWRGESAAGTTAASPAGAPGTIEAESVVAWDRGNQEEIETRFQWQRIPFTLEILYAQEDLWVLQSLMSIIRATNGDADARYKAAIKEITSIRFGKSAIGTTGNVKVLWDEGVPAPTDTPQPTTTAAAGVPEDPGTNRYVDTKFDTLPIEKLRGIATATSIKAAEPSDAFLALAKRIPVRMSLKMDQRKLHRFVAECGNARLPLEIRQIRINPQSGAAGGGAISPSAGPSPGPIPGFTPGGEGYPGPRPGGPAPGHMPSPFGGPSPFGPGPVASSGAPLTLSSDSSFDVPVEMYGIVYIYNPVNDDVLGVPKVSPEAPANAATPGG